MKKVQVISIQHQQFPLETIGKFHLDSASLKSALLEAKEVSNCDEIMYINTCNRVEWIFTLDHFVCHGLTAKIISIFCNTQEEEFIKTVAKGCVRLSGEEAVLHCIKTAGSINSAVIGEHEILGQMRASYELSVKHDLAKDGLRILMKQCVKTSKQIFTETDLRRKPVSIVSIAWKAFQNKFNQKDIHIGLIGAGQIITNFAKFLKEEDYSNIHVFNRSLIRAQQIAQGFEKGTAHTLEALRITPVEIDAWIVCTGSTDFLLFPEQITPSKKRVFVMDLALPQNVHPTVALLKNVESFDMRDIQAITSENIAFRNLALEQCEPIVMKGLEEYKILEQERKVELAMQSIPATIKEIKKTALGSVFLKEFEGLDEHSKEVIENILDYMEKKYISVPMKMAKAVLLDLPQKN